MSSHVSFNRMVERLDPALDRTYQALAHPVRRAMLQLLRTGEMRVTDLAEPFDVSLAAASKHIQVLQGADLLTRTVAGRDHFLSLDARRLVEAGDWIDSYRSFWEARLDALEHHLRGGSTDA
jgi:DNA-binding transcriptional ArsR family regulator